MHQILWNTFIASGKLDEENLWQMENTQNFDQMIVGFIGERVSENFDSHSFVKIIAIAICAWDLERKLASVDSWHNQASKTTRVYPNSIL